LKLMGKISMNWIKTSERMPPKGLTVLVTDGMFIYTAQYVSEFWHCECGCYCGMHVYDVSYWMPLPELPTKEEF
jgi:hypothetical protein